MSPPDRDSTDRQRAEEALRASEERYRDLFENAHDIIYTLDLEGRLTSLNRRAEQVLGYTQAENVGRHVIDMVPPEFHPAMHEALRRKLEGETAPTVYELEVIARDGRRVPLEISSRAILRDGQPVGIQGIARDITERRRSEAALREADRRKDDFLAMLAHELRNPLVPIRNGLEIVRRSGNDPAAVDQALEMMERQLQKLNHMVHDLLDVSRITRGKIELRRERMDLARLARASVADHRPAFTARGVALYYNVPDTPVWVSGDATRLAQVLDNLLGNALTFTGAGGETRVNLNIAPASRLAILTVQDTGAGIEPDLLPMLFQPFSQADRTLDRSRGGLGLGLSIVKGLVELHGGTVRANSAGPGHGATFTVALPCEEEPSALTSLSPTKEPAATPLRVLVVEDSKDAADSLRMLLEMSGHDVAVAYTGPDGVRTATQYRPAVVICDIGLPGLDGYGVARALRKDPVTASARLIALTGYGQEEDRRRAREAGFDHHLVKPADPDVLEELLVSG